MAVSASDLTKLVIDSVDAGRLAKAPKEIREAANKLKTILSGELPYILEAENKVLDDEAFRGWLLQLRRVLYSAEQSLDTYGSASDELDKPPSYYEKMKQYLFPHNDSKQNIRSITESIGKISGNKRPEKLVESKENDQRKLKCRDNIVGTGIDLEISAMVEKLTEDINHPEDINHHHLVLIFAIFGIGGIGKTTMAQKIFDDERINSAFSMRLCVSISKGFVELLPMTMHAVAGEALRGTRTLNELKKLLPKIIEGKRILLVVDDMDKGDTEVYENLVDILKVLSGGVQGNRVLITTDNEKFGNDIKSAQTQKDAGGVFKVQVHRLLQLTVEDGCKLLLRAACPNQAKVNELKKTGMKIVQKCNGLPLAINIVGGFLYGRSETEEWTALLERSTLSFKDPATDTGVIRSIYLSYQDALPHLKQCLLYLSLFPVDVEIDQHWVTQLWISEGLVDTRNYVPTKQKTEEQSPANGQPSQDDSSQSARQIANPETLDSQLSQGSSQSSERILTREETAERYFMELVGRGFLQVEHKTKGYKMPKDVRKFVQTITKDEVFACHPKHEGVDKLSERQSLRHLSFLNKEITVIPKDVGRLRSLRTLLLCGNPLNEKGLDIIFKNLQFLRVLDVARTEIKYIPDTLGKLVHLRHLNFSQTRIEAVPMSIGRLSRLRFLDLQKCHNLTVPKDIEKLQKLEYLNLQDTKIQQKPPELKHMSQLTFLHGFVPGINGWSLEELEVLTNLSNLQIKVTKTGEVLKKMDNLRNLELNLELSGNTNNEQLLTLPDPQECLKSLKIDGYNGSIYPEWLSASKLPNLQQLDLVNCNIGKSLTTLCQLKNLKFLSMANLSEMTAAITMQPSNEMQLFPLLEELHMEDMQDFDSWSTFKADDLPLLRKFTVRRCPKLTQLPDDLPVLEELLVEALHSLSKVSNVPLLKVFTIIDCPELIDVSGMPLLQVFTITDCPMLKDVSGMNSLRHIHIKDEQLTQLPGWLVQHASKIETLDIEGKKALLGRCERNKEDWYIIREIAHVYAYMENRSSFFSYTRSNDFFCKYQKKTADAQEHSSPAAAESLPETSEQKNGVVVNFAIRVQSYVNIGINFIRNNPLPFLVVLVAFITSLFCAAIFWILKK